MLRWSLLLLLLSPVLLPAEAMLSPAAELAADRFTAELPPHAVVRIDSLGDGAATDFAWLLGAALTERGLRISDPAQLARNHRELLALQDDPVYAEADRPGGFLPPTHRVWGRVRLERSHHLGKPVSLLRVRVGLESLADGVTLSRFDIQQRQKHNPPVWTLLALLAATLLAVTLINAFSRGYLGVPALILALLVDLGYLAWFLLA